MLNTVYTANGFKCGKGMGLLGFSRAFGVG